MNEPEVIRRLLTETRTWAMVGASNDRYRDSNHVMALLLRHGIEVVPVTPNADEVLGRRAYPTLADAAADHAIEVVDCFRRRDEVGVHVDEAVEIGAGAVWLQLGVIDVAAAERAAAAGLDVVMDRCPAIELPRL